MVCALVLAGCVVTDGPGAEKTAAPNPVTGGEIEVVPLDDLPAAATPVTEDAAKDAPAAVADSETPAAQSAGPDDPRPRPRPDAAADAAPAPEVAPPVPEAQKSAAQIACEKKKGVWSRAGKGGNACVTYTRDGGKSCTTAKDCDSQCLARSGTCAPFKPLFGCNEILDDIGRRMTLCVD